MIFLNILSQGDSFFMLPILILLIVVIVLIAKALMSDGSTQKMKSLIASLGLFAAVWGVLGQTIGLIGGFDAIEAQDGVSPQIIAGGLKLTFLPLAFGLVVFLVARLGIIALTVKEK